MLYTIRFSKIRGKHIRAQGSENGRWSMTFNGGPNKCGESEQAHAVMRDDLPGDKLSSADFGENAAWRWIVILVLNLNAMMKELALGESWQPKRMKAVWFSLINLTGRVVNRSLRLIIRLTKITCY